MKKTAFLLTFLVVFLTALQGFSAQLFYLSTEKTFSPSETKRVKIESGMGVKALNIRVYKINNPQNFFMAQKDFHKPTIINREFRQNTLDTAQSFLGYLKKETQGWLLGHIPQSNRTHSTGVFPELKGSLDSTTVTPAKVLKPLKDRNYQLLQEFVHNLPGFDQNWNYNYLFLQSLASGMYLIEASFGQQVGYTVLNISDYGFIIKKDQSNLLTYTVKNETGEPLKGVEITAFDKNKNVIKKMTSNKEGLSFQNIIKNKLFLLGQTKDGTCSFYDPQYFPLASQNLKVYMITERPVYRAEDKVYFKGFIRNYQNSQYHFNNQYQVGVKIINPRGETLQNLPIHSSNRGSFDGSFTLPKDIPSGRYLIVAFVNNIPFEAEFKVEYYQKPDFEVKVKPVSNFALSGKSIEAQIESQYYAGHALANAKTTVSLYRTRISDSAFEDLSNQDFLSSHEKIQAQMELLETKDLYLDGQGKTQVQFNTEKSPLSYSYKIEARVTNDAGVGITSGSRITVVPANLKIGIQSHKFVYLVGEKVSLDLLTHDYFGKPLVGDFHIKASSEGEESTEIFYDRYVKTNEKGQQTIEFEATKPGFLKVFVEGEDEQGYKAFQEIFLWVGKEGAGYSYQGGMVRLVLDKEHYAPGDKARLLVLSPVSDLPFLFTLEGDDILEYRVEKLTKNSALVEIPIKAKDTPNIFATVHFIFQNQHYSNTIKLSIPPWHQFLNITLTPNQERYKPGQQGEVKVKVTDYQGKAVKNTELAIGVVDEAIYAISAEIAPDIREFFYSFRRNAVKTWNSIGFRFYGYSESVSKEMANKLFGNPTGLAAFKESDQTERKEFKDTIFWNPSIITDDNGEATFKVQFSDNITKWRITALGMSPQTYLGKNTQSMITRLDFYASLTHPTFLNEKDKGALVATLHNNTSEILKGEVFLEGDNIEIVDNQQEVEIQPGKVLPLTFSISSLAVGPAQVRLKVKAGKYEDSLIKSFSIIPHSLPQTYTQNNSLTLKNSHIDFTLPSNLKKESMALTLDFSYGYVSAINQALPYLISYPWGCVEQTTSSFLPNLVALRALKNLNLSLPHIQEETNKNTQESLGRLYGFQNSQGGWGWFNEENTDLFMTAYVAYALSLSKNLGVKIENQVLQKGLNALIKELKTDNHSNTAKIFALYVLSLNNSFYPAVLNKITSTNLDHLTAYELALLILTYNQSKNKEMALQLAQKLKEKAFVAGNYAYWGNIQEQKQIWWLDSVETTAWALFALNSVQEESSLIHQGAGWLLMQRKGAQWKSTRDTGAAVMALSSMVHKAPFYDNNTLVVSLNDHPLGNIAFNKNQFQGRLVVAYEQLKDLIQEENKIQIKGIQEEERVFSALSLSYNTEKEPIAPYSSGISVKRTYHRLEEYKEGNQIFYKLGRETKRGEKGDNLVVKLEITSQEDYQYLMLEDYFCAGAFPVKDFKLNLIKDLESESSPVFADFRDEKVAFFFSEFKKKAWVYYVISPVFQGKYRMIPAQASLMYYPEINGNSEDQSLNIE